MKNKYNKLQKMCFSAKKYVQKCKYGIIYSSIRWCRPDRYSGFNVHPRRLSYKEECQGGCICLVHGMPTRGVYPTRKSARVDVYA